MLSRARACFARLVLDAGGVPRRDRADCTDRSQGEVSCERLRRQRSPLSVLACSVARGLLSCAMRTRAASSWSHLVDHRQFAHASPHLCRGPSTCCCIGDCPGNGWSCTIASTLSAAAVGVKLVEPHDTAVSYRVCAPISVGCVTCHSGPPMATGPSPASSRRSVASSPRIRRPPTTLPSSSSVRT